MRIIDPYREENRRHLRWLNSLSHEEHVALLKKIGILDKNGKLAAKYRTPKEELAVSETAEPSKSSARKKPKTAKPRAARGKASTRKRAS